MLRNCLTIMLKVSWKLWKYFFLFCLKYDVAGFFVYYKDKQKNKDLRSKYNCLPESDCVM